MYAARVAKPKLSISIASATTNASRPSLSLKSPASLTIPRTPLSPSSHSPTSRNTRLNQQGRSTMQVATFSYTNSSTSKSILKKTSSSSARGKSIQFHSEPTVHCVTPINDPDYYGGYTKMTKDERRWIQRS